MPTNARSLRSTVTRASVTVGKSGCAIAPLNRRSSMSTARISSYRVTSQARRPFQSVTAKSGPALRARAYSDGGWNGHSRPNGNRGASGRAVAAAAGGAVIVARDSEDRRPGGQRGAPLRRSRIRAG